MKFCENSECQKKFKPKSRYQKYCNDCHKKNKTKGGKIMTPVQKQYNKQVEKKSKAVKKEKIENKVEETDKLTKEERKKVAEKCIELLKENNVSNSQMRAVFSCAYNLAPKK